MNNKVWISPRELRLTLAQLTRPIPDRLMLQILFFLRLHRRLDLKNPLTYNEKLQWLKLYDRRPEYTVMADKYAVRDYVREKLGGRYLIPLLGVWDRPEDIDFDALPPSFVLKCNHDSGGVLLCRDSRQLDRKQAVRMLKRNLRRSYYLLGREWPYKNIPRKIICEQLLTDEAPGRGLMDYKFYCFDGHADCVMVCADRSRDHVNFYFFDRDWNLIPQYNMPEAVPPAGFTLPRPPCMEEMFRMAETLSAGLPQARIDLYACGDRPYFGEITLFNASGFDARLPEIPDRKWGSLTKLPPKN